MKKFIKLMVSGRRFLSAGFTTVEFLVTVFVFSIMAIITTSVLVRAIDIERRGFGAQVVQENALAVLELMAKEIRVSNIVNQDNNCNSGLPSTTLTISHPDEGTIVYSLNGSGIVERRVGPSGSAIIHTISSNDVIFDSLNFCIIGTASLSDNQSPRVTILASISNVIGRGKYIVNLQTTIVSRDLFDELQN